jgi:hypothetical protein
MMSPSEKEQRFRQLLKASTLALFTQGGCHVFALALAEKYERYKLGGCKKETGAFAHIFCVDGEFVIDVYGVSPIPFSKYRYDDWYQYPAVLLDKGGFLKCLNEDLDGVKSGLYAQKWFLDEAGKLAINEITQNIQRFDANSL